MATLHVLRVFCAEDGSGGNPLGVFLDGDEIPESERQGIAADLGFSETVFVEDRDSATLRIFTPAVELPLAGHPLVGSAWLLARAGAVVSVLRPPAGEVPVRFERELTWIAAKPEWAPQFEFVQLRTPAEVDALTEPPEGMNEVGVWAWIDEAKGLIRERVFVPELGIDEDEATGAAALLLVDRIGREIEIRQGTGSIIRARTRGDAMVEVGGRVEHDEIRDY